MRSITTRFLLPAAVVVVLFCVLVIWCSYRAHQERVLEIINDQAALALEFDLAIRDYVGATIRPTVEKLVAPDEFIPEVMSTSFVAREVFERVRRTFPDVVIKFSSDNPRNPANQAGPEESKALGYFNANPQADRWTGLIELNGMEYFAHFKPRRMEQSCLRCHGRPEDAPASLVQRYGPTAGFHRRVGDVVALDTVAIPFGPTRAKLIANMTTESAFPTVGLVLGFGAIAWMFHRVVGRRLARMRAHFEQIAAQPECAAVGPIDVGGCDEISALADSFNGLAGRLRESYASLERRVEERTGELARTNRELQREIGDRRQAEETLRASNQELKDLNTRLASTADDLKGLMRSVAEENAVAARFHNPSLRRCWQVQNCDQRSCPAYGREDALKCWEVAGTFCKGQVQGEFARKLQDCRLCEVYQSARQDPLNELGETFNDMVAILEDRQGALERALRTAEAGTRAKSEFLANMSHEIRTPMTAILGFTSVIQEPITSCTVCPSHANCAQRCKTQELVETVRRNAQHLLSIVDDILDLSKIEAGKMVVERISASPCELIAQVASLMRVRAEDKGLQLSIEYEGAIPETMQTDPTRLRQILVNVLGNAIKFTEVGTIRLITRFVPPGAGRGTIAFDVLDTGIGMTAEQAVRLFQPFTQADASTSRKFGGTGLGLSISRRLAQMLGGDVELVETKPGAGTRFRVTVDAGSLDGVAMVEDPLAATALAGKPTAPQVEAEETGPLAARILLAEDGPDNQRLIAHFLSKSGAAVTLVENGRLAVQAAMQAHAAGAPFDVILMDIQMPEMDGYEATRLLRWRGYRGKIIALTAHAMAQDRGTCLDAGCDDYLSKPVERHQLLAAIRRQLGARPAVGKDAPAPVS